MMRGIYGAGRCKHHAHDRAGGVKMSGLTMGSLFDGIGGFPLAAIRSWHYAGVGFGD